MMTLFPRAKARRERGQKDAVTRFNAYLLISKGDPDRAMNMVRKFAPGDMQHEALLRRTAKAVGK